MNTQNAGIDYGNGTTNIDAESGIRYGVIPAYAIGSAWYGRSEAQYGEPTCPECGGDVVEYDDDKHGDYELDGIVSDYACESCLYVFDAQDAFPEEAQAYTFEADGYTCEQSAGSYASSDDIFILKSPYFTYCAFCSPCAPGAGYLLDCYPPCTCSEFILPHAHDHYYTYKEEAEMKGYIRAYCFGHDWFEGGKAPYTVYSVSTGELITSEKD